MQSSRRSFLKQSASIGLASIAANSFASTVDSGDIDLANGAVFLFQGDSITDGNRGRNADLNHIMGHGYVYSVASRIGADFPASNFQFVNKGVSGNTVTDLLKRWKEDTLDTKPQVLSLLIGINDINAEVNGFNGAQNFEEFKNGYRSLLEQAQKQNPEILFVLCLPFVAKGTRTNAKLELFEKLVNERGEFIRTIAEEFHGVVVDYPSMFEGAYKKQSVEYWIWDGVHPTVFGHELMSREWIKVVSKKLRFLKKYKY